MGKKGEQQHAEKKTHHLVDFLEGAVLDLGKEEIDPDRGDHCAWKPNEAILGTPVQTVRVDEVRRGEDAQPGPEETHHAGEAEDEGPQSQAGHLATDQPRVGGQASVVAEHVDDVHGDNDLAGRGAVGLSLVHAGLDELHEAADGHTGHQDGPAAQASDEEGGGEDAHHGQAGKDAAVFEGFADSGHLEEVSAVHDHDCEQRALVEDNNGWRARGLGLTHGAGGRQEGERAEREQSPTALDLVGEDVGPGCFASTLHLKMMPGFDGQDFGIDVGAFRP